MTEKTDYRGKLKDLLTLEGEDSKKQIEFKSVPDEFIEMFYEAAEKVMGCPARSPIERRNFVYTIGKHFSFYAKGSKAENANQLIAMAPQYAEQYFIAAAVLAGSPKYEQMVINKLRETKFS